jgi:hypothetical protein
MVKLLDSGEGQLGEQSVTSETESINECMESSSEIRYLFIKVEITLSVGCQT